MSDLSNDFVIDDFNYQDVCQEFQSGQQTTRGLVPRDFVRQPMGSGAGRATGQEWGTDIPLIAKAEWSDRIKEMERSKSRLSDIRNTGDNGNRIESLDQNGQGFCWAYSTTAAVMLLRARDGMPHVRLSAHGVAMKIYGRDRGAWGALSLEFIAENGVPSVEAWPEKSMNMRHNTDETWADAKKYRVAEGWADLDVQAYDRELTFAQVATCLLSRIPVVLDFNWWGHSVCGMDLAETSPGEFGIRILNSWTDNWGEAGTSVLAGTKAIPDGASAPRLVVGA